MGLSMKAATGRKEKVSASVLMLGAGLDVQGGITSVEKLILDNAPPDLSIHHVATFAKGSAAYNIQVFLNAIAVLIESSLSNKIDVVHIHFSDRGSTLRKSILALIALTLRKPFILHAHGAAYKEFYSKLPRLVQRIITSILGRCTLLIALSENWRSYYLTLFHLKPDQVTVLRNPVVLPAIVPQRRGRQEVTFVFLGRIGKRGGALDMARSVVSMPQQDKGAFDLIRAFAALPEQIKVKARLILAGNGDIEAAEQLIQELGLSDRALIHSWLDPTQRDQLLADADAFILPSYNEGLPMSMLEAMAWGLPVIVTPVGGIPEVVTHSENGLLVTPGHQEEIAQAMQQLIQSENLRIALGNAARNSVKCLDIDSYVASLHELYIATAYHAEPQPQEIF